MNKKVRQALNKGLLPIVCVGETLKEREAGKANDVIERQVTGALKDVTAAEMQKIVIAYEPVWAIGTGKTATPDQANEIHSFIRKKGEIAYGKEIAERASHPVRRKRDAGERVDAHGHAGHRRCTRGRREPETGIVCGARKFYMNKK